MRIRPGEITSIGGPGPRTSPLKVADTAAIELQHVLTTTRNGTAYLVAAGPGVEGEHLAQLGQRHG